MTSATARLGTIPDVIRLRERVSRLFVVLLWVHVPIIVGMAVHNGTNVAMQILIVATIVIVATLAVRIDAGGMPTRLIVALALTCMPILIVYNGTGPWQIDYHMYFFAIFAMLVAYCDWRPILLAAALTTVHHLIFDVFDPARVFPGEGGLDRVALHAGLVAVECGVLIWITMQLRRLFVDFAAARRIAERALARADEVTHLRYAASHDDLTGTENRPAFLSRLQGNLERLATHPKYNFAVLFLDLDNFKAVNDRLGHVVGDVLLESFARRLDRSIRPQDSVARLGGDEFAIIVDEIEDVSIAKVVAERIIAAMKDPFELNGHTVAMSTSVGIAFSIGHTGPLVMLRDADAAMYRAKNFGAGSGGYATFGQFGEADGLPRGFLHKA
jgi:diguanylate cyclase (GGDEF)-like protein